jgi:hypothetical protein
MKNLLYILLGILTYSCKPKLNLPTEDQIIQKLSNLSNLGTVEYTLSKIIQADDKQWYTIGPRKILMECKAYVKAGIDFNEIKILEINDSLKSIKLQIPSPNIILINIPPSSIKIIETNIGSFRSNFSNEEINAIQTQAEKDILNKIYELNILPEAKRNGKLFLLNLLKQLGFKHITITDHTIANPINLPI